MWFMTRLLLINSNWKPPKAHSILTSQFPETTETKLIIIHLWSLKSTCSTCTCLSDFVYLSLFTFIHLYSSFFTFIHLYSPLFFSVHQSYCSCKWWMLWYNLFKGFLQNQSKFDHWSNAMCRNCKWWYWFLPRGFWR